MNLPTTQDAKPGSAASEKTPISIESTSDFPSFHATLKPGKDARPSQKSQKPSSKDNQPSKGASSSEPKARTSPRDAKSSESSQLSLSSLLSNMSTSADYVAAKPAATTLATATTTTKATAENAKMAATTTTTKKAPPPGFSAVATTIPSTPSTASAVRKPPPGFESTLSNDSRENTPPLPRPHVKPPPGLPQPAYLDEGPASVAEETGTWDDLDAGDGWANSGKKTLGKDNNTGKAKIGKMVTVNKLQWLYIPYLEW